MTNSEYTEKRDKIIRELLETQVNRKTLDIKSIAYNEHGIKQLKLERELTLLKQEFKNRTKAVQEEAIFTPKKIPDTYTGIRCEYCGGETNNGLCTNSSPEWPHAPYDLLSNVQPTVSTEQI